MASKKTKKKKLMRSNAVRVKFLVPSIYTFDMYMPPKVQNTSTLVVVNYVIGHLTHWAAC
jgi:hypothetical protein